MFLSFCFWLRLFLFFLAVVVLSRDVKVSIGVFGCVVDLSVDVGLAVADVVGSAVSGLLFCCFLVFCFCRFFWFLVSLVIVVSEGLVVCSFMGCGSIVGSSSCVWVFASVSIASFSIGMWPSFDSVGSEAAAAAVGGSSSV